MVTAIMICILIDRWVDRDFNIQFYKLLTKFQEVIKDFLNCQNIFFYLF